MSKANEMIGKVVIVRGDRSGVFFGKLVEQIGSEVVLKDCRRLWYWDGANSVSELAVSGTKEPKNCKFTVSVESIKIIDAIEIIPCTDDAIKKIAEVSVWKY